MKTCPVCALDVEDTYSFCPEDGSILRAPDGPAMNEAPRGSEADDETAGSVVLYCPTCAAEYPLTFSECPTHGVKLTKHNISRLPNRAITGSIESESNQSNPSESTRSNERNSDDPLPRQEQGSERVAEVSIGVSAAASAVGFHYPQRNSVLFTQERTEPDYDEPLAEPNKRFEQPRFRTAAIATMIGLVVLALVAMYAFFSNLSRRTSTRVAQVTEASPQLFVPTPQEAQDYTEPQSAPGASKAPETRADLTAEQKSDPALSRSERAVSAATVVHSDPKPVEPQRSKPATNVSTSSLPPLPRGNSGGFDARLIRVRSNKTSSGVRYDLTFNMQEQAGRSTQWQRVLITTKSASGVNHSQAIPFAHRLGATGALTFTISVELAGRSEADWHGRVVFTTLGWDNQGAPLQASFGADLTH